MAAFELDHSYPYPHFIFDEAYKWVGKEVYLKPFHQIGFVEEMKRVENNKGYELLINCNGFPLQFSKQDFLKWVELKDNVVHLRVRS